MSKHSCPVGLVVLALLIIGCQERDASGTDLAQTLESHVRFLASDSLEGRLPGTRGIEKTASYIAEEFETMGLEAAFEGSHFQEFDINLGFTVEAEPFLQIDSHPPTPAHAIAALPVSGSGGVRGEPVGGLPEQGDLTGQIVFRYIPPEIEEERWTMMGRDGVLEYVRDIAARAEERGAAAAVFVSGSPYRPDADLHAFPLRRSYRQVSIPTLEITYAEMPETGTSGSSDARTCSLSVAIKPRSVQVRNVGGMIRGTANPDEYVVVGAHYDHLGYGDIASSTPWRREIHNGADDNASGVAAVIEIARRMASGEEPERSIVFVCFTAEELGAIGSEYYCKHPPFPVESTTAMINLDTVGRMEEGKLIVFGARSAKEMSDVLGRVNQAHSLELIEKKEIYGFSDQNPFYARGVPSLHFFTGAYDDYHSPDDDWDNLDYEGLSSLTSYVADFTLAVSAIDRLTPVIEAEEKSPPEMSRGSGAFLGIVPDFAYSGTGVGLKGTVPESPAEVAGLRDGDVIVSIDGKPIADLRALMYFLAGSQPGDEIDIQIMRGSAPDLRNATLSIRSSRKQSK